MRIALVHAKLCMITTLVMTHVNLLQHWQFCGTLGWRVSRINRFLLFGIVHVCSTVLILKIPQRTFGGLNNVCHSWRKKKYQFVRKWAVLILNTLWAIFTASFYNRANTGCNTRMQLFTCTGVKWCNCRWYSFFCPLLLTRCSEHQCDLVYAKQNKQSDAWPVFTGGSWASIHMLILTVLWGEDKLLTN